MFRARKGQTRLLFKTRILLHIFRLALLGPVGLEGCAAPLSIENETPQPVVTGLPTPLAVPLYNELRNEDRGFEPVGATAFRKEPEAARFIRRMSRLLGRPVRTPARSPDGNRIVFVVTPGNENKEGDIWISQADGTWPYLLHSGGARAERTVWTSDGSPEGRIYFSSGGRVWSLRPILLDVEETES